MRSYLASLSSRAEKAAFLGLLVLLYGLAFAFEPGTFPQVLVHALFWGAGFATGWALAYLTPSPRGLRTRETKLLIVALAVGVLVVFFALPTVLGPHLAELGRGLLVGCLLGTLAVWRNLS